jgi:predicted TIM-barrel fold metal-dependent hydrolase
VAGAIAELDRAYDELGLDGVMLLTNVAGTYLGDPASEPVFAALAERDAYVFVHPAFPPHPVPLPHPIWLYEFPFETVRAVTNLIYSGTLERHPSIRYQLSHLGGAAPFLAHRIASLADREPDQAAQAPAGALAYLERLYYDTGLANHAPGVVATREVTPLSHIVFGTDWPYAALPPDGGDPAPGLNAALNGSERAAVESANAAALVPRLAGRHRRPPDLPADAGLAAATGRARSPAGSPDHRRGRRSASSWSGQAAAQSRDEVLRRLAVGTRDLELPGRPVGEPQPEL